MLIVDKDAPKRIPKMSKEQGSLLGDIELPILEVVMTKLQFQRTNRFHLSFASHHFIQWAEIHRFDHASDLIGIYRSLVLHSQKRSPSICACFCATDRSGAERKATKGEYTWQKRRETSRSHDVNAKPKSEATKQLWHHSSW